jgi:hypothetical protein
MAGIVKFSTSGGDSQTPFENWMKLFYSIGMGLLVLSPWVIVLFKLKGWNQTQFWGECIISFVLFAGIVLIKYSQPFRSRLKNSSVGNFAVAVTPFGKGINRFFHFNWVYRMIAFLFSIQKWIVEKLNMILEGEGGILWALVFLVLLVSMLVNGRSG